MGWSIDWVRFRKYLVDKYSVSTAYLFIGFMQSNQDLYSELQKAGYVLIFKPIIVDNNGKAKGNCDADLVLRAILEKDNYDKDIWYSWMFYFYIATIHALLRIRERAGAKK